MPVRTERDNADRGAALATSSIALGVAAAGIAFLGMRRSEYAVVGLGELVLLATLVWRRGQQAQRSAPPCHGLRQA
jgi:hypothetical protein